MVSTLGAVSQCTPSVRSASIINSVSRERSNPRNVTGFVPSAARMRKRLDRDLLPGMVTVALSGRLATGAGQGSGYACSVMVTIVSETPHLATPHHSIWEQFAGLWDKQAGTVGSERATGMTM